jgi:FkbM family methyltransferase
MNINNYLLAKNNTKFYKNVYIHNQAIWNKNTEVSYNADSDFDAYSINENNDSGKKVTVKSTTIQSIIDTYNLTHIDYVKMDIEGAEEAILEDGDLQWLQYVKAINIEMHLDKSKDINTYIDILKTQGFNAWKDQKHWSSIMAVKKS